MLTSNLATFLAMAFIMLAMVFYMLEVVRSEIVSISIIAFFVLFFLWQKVDFQGNPINAASTLKNFGDTNLVSVMCLMIIGKAIINNGIFNWLVTMFGYIKPKYGNIVTALMLLMVVTISAFINDTPVVVIFIPVFLKLCDALNIKPNQVMMPVSFAAILGGMITVIGTSTNILIVGAAAKSGVSISIFEFVKPAMFCVVPAVIYLIFIMPALLPKSSSNKSQNQFIWGGKFYFDIVVLENAKYSGKNAINSKLPFFPNIEIMSVERDGKRFEFFGDQPFKIIPGDLICLRSDFSNLVKYAKGNKEAILHPLFFLSNATKRSTNSEKSLVEVMLAPNSEFVGKTMAFLTQSLNYMPFAVQKAGTMLVTTPAQSITLDQGDVILLMCNQEKIYNLEMDKNFILLSNNDSSRIITFNNYKRTLVASIFLSVILMSATETLPISVSSFIGASLLLIFKCITIKDALTSLDSKIFFIISASLVMSMALEKTGAAQLLAQLVVQNFHNSSPINIMLALFLVNALFTNILSNNACGLLFTPIAINIANTLGVDVKMFIYAVIFASNCSFLTPFGYQTNLLVAKAGGYETKDFMRAGLPLFLTVIGGYYLYCRMFFV